MIWQLQLSKNRKNSEREKIPISFSSMKTKGDESRKRKKIFEKIPLGKNMNENKLKGKFIFCVLYL